MRKIPILICLVSIDPLSADEIQFNRDVRPILADKCYRCHGPDAAARQADLRLDQRDSAIAGRDGHQAVSPGRPGDSELVRRISSDDPNQRMPPPDSGLTLSPDDRSVLRAWVSGGAAYQAHWSFIPPRRPPPPLQETEWPRNAIDRFVLRRLRKEGVVPAPEASRATLLRRVTLDLTGLPPRLDEIEAFHREAQLNPGVAYEKLVDRLLASPRFGERMAIGWLDAARYADTNGYFTDDERTMWPWRDWVINALNANMPFDQFTIEQLAGDLLPHPTLAQRIATGFNRNHMVNNETGIIEEESRVEYVVDRVDTTATVWMGLTLSCARCHNHKYDPISQKDFYRFFAFFNNVPERGLSGSGGNSVPTLPVPVPEHQERLASLRRRIDETQRVADAAKEKLDADQTAWESALREQLPDVPSSGLAVHARLDGGAAEALPQGSVEFVHGMLGSAARFSGQGSVDVSEAPDIDTTDAFSFGAWVKPEGAGCVISKMDDASDLRGFDLTLRKSRAVVNLVHRWNSSAIQVTSTTTVPNGQWQHLMVTVDGSGKADGVRFYLDGKTQPVSISQDHLSGTIRNTEPLRIGRRQASASFKGLIDDVRVYDRELAADEVQRLASSQLLKSIIPTPADERSDFQKRKLTAWYLEHEADRTLAASAGRLAELRAEYSKLARDQTTTMVMQESDKPRPAFVLVRGLYDQPGEQVTALTPAFLSGESGRFDPTRGSRLDLARWLVHPDHPLTARVTVNRLWQQVFGTGLVKTVDDFGTQGESPSHPDLLDWLAVELIESGWDLKHVLRLMVTSTTYRQSSHATPEQYRLDPENRLLARGSRFRMDAEMLRDNALAISGLLVERLGGPSVRPYQPPGLWEDVTYDSNASYEQQGGSSLYRRSLYTFWKRQSPPPSMLAFDAPTRETCTVQRSRTNTPLQALALLNDITFVEAGRKLAERAIRAGGDESAVARFLFRSATARPPAESERQILLRVYRDQRNAFRRQPDDALKLVSVGESNRDESIDPVELAAWTSIAGMVLSLDESISRP